MNNPLVSILICCHNRRHLLQQTLESVFKQDYEPVEILVVDDGSTDGTSKLIKSYGNKLKYFRQENRGIASARNTACQLATGELIAFQDDDDLMPPNRIVDLYQALSSYPSAVLAVGDFSVIDANGNSTGKRWLPHNASSKSEPILVEDGYEAVLWPKVPAAPHTTLFRKADGNRIGWFDTNLRNSEDKDFFARLARLGPIAYVPKIVSLYRRGHGSLTKNTILSEYYIFLALEKHLNCLDYENHNLQQRLHLRIFTSLRKIASLKKQGLELPDSVPDDYINRGLSLLGFKYRLKYKWATLVKFPLRSLLK